MTACKHCVFATDNGGTCQKDLQEGAMCWQYEPIIKTYEDMRREEPALVSLEMVAMKFRPEDYHKTIKPILLKIVGSMAKGAPKEMQTSQAWDMAFNRIHEILEMQERTPESTAIN